QRGHGTRRERLGQQVAQAAMVGRVAVEHHRAHVGEVRRCRRITDLRATQIRREHARITKHMPNVGMPQHRPEIVDTHHRRLAAQPGKQFIRDTGQIGVRIDDSGGRHAHDTSRTPKACGKIPSVDTLLLLHGLGATGAVWDGLTGLLDRPWLAPDLPGHGGAARLPRYSFGGMAAAIADELPDIGPFVVVGHSLGGVVALALASGWFGIDVTAVVAVGVKVEWSEEDLARAAAIAARPVRIYPTRAEAE